MNHWTGFKIIWQKYFLVDPLTKMNFLSWFVKNFSNRLPWQPKFFMDFNSFSYFEKRSPTHHSYKVSMKLDYWLRRSRIFCKFFKHVQKPFVPDSMSVGTAEVNTTLGYVLSPVRNKPPPQSTNMLPQANISISNQKGKLLPTPVKVDFGC